MKKEYAPKSKNFKIDSKYWLPIKFEKFEIQVRNIDILHENCNLVRPKSILSSANFYRFLPLFGRKNGKR